MKHGHETWRAENGTWYTGGTEGAKGEMRVTGNATTYTLHAKQTNTMPELAEEQAAEQGDSLPLPPPFTSEQRIGFTLLLIFAIMCLSLASLQLRNGLYGPLSLNKSIPITIKNEVVTIDALRYRDTSHSGLSDYDKLYVYGMSPYLYDTFGYGMSDGEVIKRGLPLCANAGKNCGGGDTSAAIITTSTISIISVPNPGTPPPDLNKMLRDPVQLRQMLLSNGMDKNLLSKINDTDLQAIVTQMMNSTSTQAMTGKISQQKL